jgi:hypothetical protein
MNVNVTANKQNALASEGRPKVVGSSGLSLRSSAPREESGDTPDVHPGQT